LRGTAATAREQQAGQEQQTPGHIENPQHPRRQGHQGEWRGEGGQVFNPSRRHPWDEMTSRHASRPDGLKIRPPSSGPSLGDRGAFARQASSFSRKPGPDASRARMAISAGRPNLSAQVDCSGRARRPADAAGIRVAQPVLRPRTAPRRPAMPARIEDYALLSDLHTAALVSRDGSVDWLCFPRFDSGACFAALLGTPEHGRWLLAPAGRARATGRRYRGETLVLETDFETDDGAVTVVDCLGERNDHLAMVRLVVGKRGRVKMKTELIIRFDYGAIVPWVTRVPGGLQAI